MLVVPTKFVLDRYHLYQESQTAFGFTSQREKWIRKISKEGLKAVMPEILKSMLQA